MSVTDSTVYFLLEDGATFRSFREAGIQNLVGDLDPRFRGGERKYLGVQLVPKIDVCRGAGNQVVSSERGCILAFAGDERSY